MDILSKCGMLGAKPTSFPMEQKIRLTNESGALISILLNIDDWLEDCSI